MRLLSWTFTKVIISRLPTLFALGLFASVYVPFVWFILIDGILIKSHSPIHFTLSFLATHALYFLALFSMFVASSRSPGTPSGRRKAGRSIGRGDGYERLGGVEDEGEDAETGLAHDRMGLGQEIDTSKGLEQEANFRGIPIEQLRDSGNGEIYARAAADAAGKQDREDNYQDENRSRVIVKSGEMGVGPEVDEQLDGRTIQDRAIDSFKVDKNHPSPTSALYNQVSKSLMQSFDTDRNDDGDGLSILKNDREGEEDFDLDTKSFSKRIRRDKASLLLGQPASSLPYPPPLTSTRSITRPPHLSPSHVPFSSARENGDGRLTNDRSRTKVPVRRWCRICRSWKPDRCHHCSACGICVLKMDHHCLWLSNCVGSSTHHSFLLFLLYTVLLSLYICLESVFLTYDFFWGISAMTADGMDELVDFKPVIWLLVGMVGGMFAIALGAFGGLHLWFLMHNQTTIENMRPSIPPIPLSAFSFIPTPSNPYPVSTDPNSLSQSRSHARESATSTEDEAFVVWSYDLQPDRESRKKLRRIAEKVNVWDLGWRANLREVFGSREGGSGGGRGMRWWEFLWPLSRYQGRDHTRGRTFPYSISALRTLKKEAWDLAIIVEPRSRENGSGVGEWDVDDGASEDDY